MKTNKKRNRGVVLWVFEWGEREREEEKEDWGLGFKKSKKKGLKMKNMRERGREGERERERCERYTFELSHFPTDNERAVGLRLFDLSVYLCGCSPKGLKYLKR